MSENKVEITFSTEQQLALLGHAITTPKVLESMIAIGIPKKLFSDPNAQKIYGIMESFVSKHHRAPTVEELKSGELRRDEKRVVDSLLNTLDASVAKKDYIALETVYDDVVQWFTGGLIFNEFKELALIWNKKEQNLVKERIHELSNKLNHIERTGLSAYAKPSSDWFDEAIDYLDNIEGKLLFTGISFLDDSTSGIRPDDMLVITSRTGVGKTQVLNNIARSIAKTGKRIGHFALEAFKGEMELRILFQEVLRNYHADPNKPQLGTIDFRMWMAGQYPELKKYRPSKEQLKKDSDNILLLYKQTSKYTMKNLEKDMLSQANNVDLFIIDHLHYIDRDGKDENAAIQEAVQSIRDINLSLNKPVILAAHVRKQMERRKDRALIPEIEDIHGSSDTSKNSTIIFTLAQLFGIDEEKVPVKQLAGAGYGQPTIMKFVKDRISGSARTGYAAATFFTRGNYHKNYVLGELSNFDTEWRPVENRPVWAKNAIEMPKLKF